MDDQVARLVDKAWALQQETRFQPTADGLGARVMIAIGGIPGSGKTSLARAVAAGLNARARAEGVSTATATAKGDDDDDDDDDDVAMAVPMDGFHLTRAQLDAMPDPVHAHARRGAEFTFDGAAFFRLVQQLKTISAEPVLCPGFDHAAKDPVAGAIRIGRAQRIVLFEGNYLLLDREPWNELSGPAYMAARWFVDVDFGVARARLVRRHVAAGIAADAESAGRRADENDLVNGAEIVAHKIGGIDETIVSREDADWR